MPIPEHFILVYDEELDKDLWIDPSEINSEKQRKYEPQKMADEFLRYGDKFEDVIFDTENQLRKMLWIYHDTDAQKQSFYRACLNAIAEKILDEYLSDELSEEIKNIILSRHGEKKGA